MILAPSITTVQINVAFFLTSLLVILIVLPLRFLLFHWVSDVGSSLILFQLNSSAGIVSVISEPAIYTCVDNSVSILLFWKILPLEEVISTLYAP